MYLAEEQKAGIEVPGVKSYMLRRII
jgi:hypothetical protein